MAAACAASLSSCRLVFVGCGAAASFRREGSGWKALGLHQAHSARMWTSAPGLASENPNYSPGKGAVWSWEGPGGVSGPCSPSFWLQRPSRQRSGTQGASSADLKLEDAPNHHSLAIRQVATPRDPLLASEPSVALRETLVAPRRIQNMALAAPNLEAAIGLERRKPYGAALPATPRDPGEELASEHGSAYTKQAIQKGIRTVRLML